MRRGSNLVCLPLLRCGLDPCLSFNRDKSVAMRSSPLSCVFELRGRDRCNSIRSRWV